MAKRKKRAFDQLSQPYDTSLKGWVKEDPARIIPILLPGAVFQEAIDTEAIKPTLHMDRIFKVLYHEKLCLLHIEFESGSDSRMQARLLAYNAILYLEYSIPVISIIVYPFRTTIATSPLRIECGAEEMLTFHFLTLPLFTLEAERYVQEHITCMYPLLPTMKGANADVITQAMHELAELYRQDEVSLAQQFVWMEILLERTTTVPLSEKAKILEGIKMYDPLWEEHPRVKKIKAEAKAEAKAEVEEAKAEVERARDEVRARTEEALQAYNRLKDDFLKIVRTRFPELTEMAEQTLEQISGPDTLHFLLVQVATATNETVARNILYPSAA